MPVGSWLGRFGRFGQVWADLGRVGPTGADLGRLDRNLIDGPTIHQLTWIWKTGHIAWTMRRAGVFAMWLCRCARWGFRPILKPRLAIGVPQDQRTCAFTKENSPAAQRTYRENAIEFTPEQKTWNLASDRRVLTRNCSTTL